MRIGKINIDITTEAGLKKAIEYLRTSRILDLPTISMLLMGYTKFYEMTKVSDTYAYTKYNLTCDYFCIYLNLKKMEKDDFTIQDFEFVVHHELFHNLFRHFTRPKLAAFSKKYRLISNIFMDAVINEYLNSELQVYSGSILGKSKIGYRTLEKMGIEIDYKVSYSVEKLINIFYEKKLDENIKVDCILIDDHELSEDEIKKETDNLFIRKGYEICNDEMYDDIVKSKIEGIIDRIKGISIKASDLEARLFETIFYKENVLMTVVLKNIFNEVFKCNTRKTYKKIHRHKEYYTGIPYKGVVSTEVKNVLIGVDTSGSISDEELSKTLNCIFNLLRNVNDVVIDLIFWSGGIDKVYKCITSAKELMNAKAFYTRATCIDKLFQYVDEMYSRKINLVVITDGHISKEKVPDIIDKLYFVLTTGIVESVAEMYPEAEVKLIKGRV